MFLKGLREEGPSRTCSPGKMPVSDLGCDGKHSQPAQADFEVLVAFKGSLGPSCPSGDTANRGLKFGGEKKEKK